MLIPSLLLSYHAFIYTTKIPHHSSKTLHSPAQVLLKEHRKKMHFPTSEYEFRAQIYFPKLRKEGYLKINK